MGKRKCAGIEETDVDNFREIWESDEHWEMRKCFILKNQHVHDEDKLKCLSQLYYNIKILGCTYSPEVMKKMDKLIDDCPKPKPKKPCFVKAESAQPTDNINTSQNITSSKYAIPRRNAASFFVSEPKNIPEQPVVLNRIQPMVVYDESVNPNQQIPRKQTVETPFFAPERKNLIEKSISVNGIQPMIVYDETINPKWMQNIIPIKSVRKTKILRDNRISGVIKSSNGENGEPVYTVVPPPQPELITTANLDMNNTNIIPNVNVNTFAGTDVSPNVIAEANEVESINAKNIDLDNITKVLNELRVEYSCPVALVECVVKQCHYQFEWKINLISDTKPTNDFNYFCEFVVNGNCVSVGRGKKQKCAKVMAAERFINKLDTKEKKRALAVRVNESIPPKVSTNFFQFMNFVIVELPHACKLDIQILRHSATFNKKKVRFNCDGSSCNIILDSKLIAEAESIVGGKTTAKAKAAKSALNSLRQICYTVKMKSLVTFDTKISKDDMKKVDVKPAAVSDNNVGNKLLRLIGWNAHEFRIRACKIILNYASSNDDNDLVFTSEFTKIERMEMHNIALRCGLKSNNLCKREKESLVLSRKYTPETIIPFLMQNGGSTNKYELIPPKVFTFGAKSEQEFLSLFVGNRDESKI